MVKGVRPRWHSYLAVLLLVFSIGGHLAILQTSAWVGMFLKYSQESTALDAMVKTFDGSNPCAMCDLVSECASSEDEPERQLTKLKIDFFLLEKRDFCSDRQAVDVSIDFTSVAAPRNSPPPSPPPRRA